VLEAGEKLTASGAAEPSTAASEAILRIEGLTRTFGGVTAVDGVTLELPRGRATGLIGANGAGKSTLINLVSGALRPDSGRITFDGEAVTGWPPSRRARNGLMRTFQHPRLVPNLTCFENVVLGAEAPTAAALGVFRHRYSSRHAVGLAQEALQRVGVPRDHWFAWPRKVSPQEWLWLEIARALAARPRLVMLDEPNTGFTAIDTSRLVDLLQEIVAAGTSVLIVSHDVSLAMRVSDVMAVLDYGKLIAYGTPHEIASNDTVVEAYLGEKGRAVAHEVLGRV
jgi:ABC-type branched-subunit amino acid transport system ATPase component